MIDDAVDPPNLFYAQNEMISCKSLPIFARGMIVGFADEMLTTRCWDERIESARSLEPLYAI